MMNINIKITGPRAAGKTHLAKELEVFLKEYFADRVPHAGAFASDSPVPVKGMQGTVHIESTNDVFHQRHWEQEAMFNV